MKLRAIWNTHHHWDHVGGNEDLAVHEEIQVCAGRHDQARVPRVSKLLDDGDWFTFGPYTGDTMFAAGCGRLFEGTPSMMHDSLVKLTALPKDAHVFPGHEYTVKNLEFACAMDPENEVVKKALASARGIREQGLPTVPSTRSSLPIRSYAWARSPYGAR